MDGPAPIESTEKRLLGVSVVVLLLAVTAAPVGGYGSQPEDGSPFALGAGQVDADAVLLSAAIQPDGTGLWQVEYRIRLDDDNTTAAFEDLRTEIAANESAYASRFEARVAPSIEDAASTTGREMAMRNVSVAASVQQLPQTYGVLVYRFEWTNFAVVSDDRIRLDDALVGFFLDEDSTLLLTWPDGYSVAEVSPSPTERREQGVVWRGPLDFGPGEPDLVLSKGTGTTGVAPSLLGVAIVALVLIGGGVGWWWRSRAKRGGPLRAEAPGGTDSGQPPDELLSNEEQVIRLLEERGGRMKQQDIVQALGWTDAKTSQVVGELRESGRIEGFRLGRENVLRLPESDTDEGDGPSADRDESE